MAAPLAAYWVGDQALPLVIAFAFIAGAVGFIGGVRRRVRPAAEHGRHVDGRRVDRSARLVRRADRAAGPTRPAGNNIGTDTLFLIVIGVVANDIGALFVGSSIGRTPLRGWISPAKTVEGLIGGTLMTLLVLFVIGLTGRSDTWTTGDLLILGVVIAVFAPAR